MFPFLTTIKSFQYYLGNSAYLSMYWIPVNFAFWLSTFSSITLQLTTKSLSPLNFLLSFLRSQECIITFFYVKYAIK